MTNQEKKDWLKRYRKHMNRAAVLKRRAIECRSLIDSVPAQKITGMPHGGTRRSMADAVQIVIDAENEFDDETALADRALKEIMRETAKLTDAQEKVILYKYIDGMEWEDVATTADYSVRQTYELHGQALKRITPQ